MKQNRKLPRIEHDIAHSQLKARHLLLNAFEKSTIDSHLVDGILKPILRKVYEAKIYAINNQASEINSHLPEWLLS